MIFIKKVGITTRSFINDINIKQDKFPHSLMDIITKFDCIPIIIPDVNDITYYLNLCDGFIIPGAVTWTNTDILVMQYVLKENKPLLGICAGMQLIANIDTFIDNTIKVNKHYKPRIMYVHEIKLNDGILKNIFNKDNIMVNSRHHYRVELKDFFKVDATSQDNVIEAISIPSYKFIVGVQWHPEDMVDEMQDKLFAYFFSIL